MKYKIRLHKGILQEIEALPVRTQAAVLRLFMMVQRGGHTHVPPPMIAYGSVTDVSAGFTLFASQDRHSETIESGATLAGFFRHSTQTYYFSEIQEFEDKTFTASGERFLEQHDYDSDHEKTFQPRVYRLLKEEWIAEQLSNSFMRNVIYGKTDWAKMEHTALEEIEHLFHLAPFSIAQYSKHRESTKTIAPFPNPLLGINTTGYLRFDQKLKDKKTPFTIMSRLKYYMNTSQRFCIINWIDETQPSTIVQAELSVLIASVIERDYPSLKVRIMDVIIKDTHGNEPYKDEYLDFCERYFSSDGTLPITMSFGSKPRAKALKEKVVKFKGGNFKINGFLDLTIGFNGNSTDYQAYYNKIKTCARIIFEGASFAADRSTITLRNKGCYPVRATVLIAVTHDLIDIAITACEKAMINGCVDISLTHVIGDHHGSYMCIMNPDYFENLSVENLSDVEDGAIRFYDSPCSTDPNQYSDVVYEAIEKQYNAYFTE